MSSIRKRIIRTAELAEQLGLAPGTLYNQWRTHPQKFPPLLALPEQRGPRWLQTDVDHWLDMHRAAAMQPARRVGRPTKAEQRQRALLGPGVQ